MNKTTTWFKQFCFAIVCGTGIAFIVKLLFPLFGDNLDVLGVYAKAALPAHALVMGVVITVALLAIVYFSFGKVWRSFQLGLLPFSMPLWAACIVASWLLVESGHLRIAFGFILGAGVIAVLIAVMRNRREKTRLQAPEATETDLPLPEDGQDLLGRGEIVESLVAKILLERPPVIAITAPYGHGKTSFLNLVLGKVRKLEETDHPIIVKFSPWLASDPNGLILSLLNSIIVEMERGYFIPGLRHDASEYARTLLSAVPKLDRLKPFFSEPSQEEQITRLSKRISATDRRVLVVLDDLDRLQSSELETVFKLLRVSIPTSRFLMERPPRAHGFIFN